MKPEELWDALEMRKGNNELYQQLLAKVKSREAGYLAALEMLPPEQRQQVEDYVAACEALDDPLVYMAYQLGWDGRPVPYDGTVIS